MSEFLPVASEVPEFTAGLVMIGMAVGILAIRIGDPLNRAFSLYLVLGGMEHVWAALDNTPAISVLAGSNLGYYRIASLFSLAYLALVYHTREAGRQLSARAAGLILVAALAAETLGVLGWGILVDGLPLPFHLFQVTWDLRLLCSAIVALAFALQANRVTGDRRTGGLLAAAAFGMEPAFRGGVYAVVVTSGLTPVRGIDLVILMAGMLAWATAFVLARSDSGAGRVGARRAAAAIAGAALLGAGVAFVRGSTQLPWGLVQLALPLLLAYAVLRHQLLGIDVKVRWGISKTTIAGVFIAVFFVASELAQEFFGETLGSAYVGIMAAGLLVFAIAPLQRIADRVAERAVPGGTPSAATPDRPRARAEELYRRSVRFALRDGRMSREEELHLFELADELGLAAGEAMRLRQEVEGETVPFSR